ncbi:uncharacterized protein LOC143368801 [Andrena cerasifolii]|uniref:uncharacterized protein LOC143368801 n=1 Tax=Andrena cerasifolii TaxID=2819439 RepID=UPI0040382E9A
MEQIIESQNELSGNIARAYENLKKLGAARITPGAVESRLGMLRRNWEKFDQQHDQLLALPAPEKREAPYFREDRYDVTEELFLVQEALFVDRQQSFAADHNESGMSSNGSSAAVHSKASLPRLPLPEFDGSYGSWPGFRDLFRSLVIRDGSLSDVERLHYLRGCIKGDALMALRHLPVRAATFARAWDLLQDHYENERLLVQAQMETLFGLQPLTRESATEFKTFYFTFCDCVEALAAMERPFDCSGDWLVYLLVEKLDQQSRREWETQLGAQATPPTFAELKAFIKNRITTVGALEGGKAKCQAEGRTTKAAGSQRSAKVLQVTKTNRSQDSCGLCGANHFVLFCDLYKSKTVRERREALLTAKLCYNCLGRHQVKDCGSEKRCQLCNGKHHTTIHEDSTNSSEVIEATTNTSCCSANSLSAVLLATARLRVLQPDGGSRIVRALIDQGSEVSLLIEALAQQLRLPRRPANIRLVGVGNHSPERIRGKVQLEFTAHFNSTTRHVIAALVLPKITSYQPRLDGRTTKWSHLGELTLADPSFESEGPIEMLLGADALALVLLHGMVKGRTGEPIAQNTTLGWIVSGPVTSETGRELADSREYSSLPCTTAEELLPLVRRFWEQEEIVVSNTYTTEEQACEDHFRSTHQRLPSGRYMVRLPLRDLWELGESRHGALRLPGLHA